MIDSVSATENCGRVVLNSFLIFCLLMRSRCALLVTIHAVTTLTVIWPIKKLHFLISVRASSSLPVVDLSSTTTTLRIR